MARGLLVIGYNVKSQQDADTPSLAWINYSRANPPHRLTWEKSMGEPVAKLIGEKCTVKCNLSGHSVTVLLDLEA